MAQRVAVVGAGFAGLATAISLARAGAKVHLYEEHGKVGYPPHCTGVVSGTTLAMLGKPGSMSLAGEFCGLKIVYKGAVIAEVIPSDGVYRVDRVTLEELMLREAEREGVEVYLGERVLSVTPHGKVRSIRGAGRYDYVVIADGWARPLSSALGLGGYRRRLTGFNAVVPQPFSDCFIVVEPWAPGAEGFFSWRVPGDRLLVGAASSEHRRVARLARKLAGKAMLIYGGQVVLGPPRGPLRKGRVLVTGDAAGLTKPLTGGGLYPALKAAKLAETLALTRGLGPGEALHVALLRVARELALHEPAARLFQEDKALLDAALSALEGVGPLRIRVSFDSHSLVSIIRAAVTGDARKTLRLALSTLSSPRASVKVGAASLHYLALKLKEVAAKAGEPPKKGGRKPLS